MDIKEVKAALDKIEEEVKARLGQLTEKVSKRDEELKSYGEITETTAKETVALTTRLKELGEEFKGIQTNFENLEAAMNRGSTGMKSGGGYISPAEVFINDPGVLEQIKLGAHRRKNFRITGPQLKYMIPKAWDFKATGITGGANLRANYATQYLTEIFADPLRPDRVRDLIPVLPTSQIAVNFIREDVFDNNAAMVAEEGTKPESSITFVPDSEAVKTMAHWLPATKQLLDDIQMLQGYIETRLIEGLKLVEDIQLIYGDGEGENLQGFMTLDDSLSLTREEDDTYLDTVLKAMTLVQTTAFYQPTGIILNPLDWQRIVLQKGEDGHYIFANVQVDNLKRLWGLPVVVTTAMEEGDFCVANFRQACTIWDREEAGIDVSDSHKDFFEKNIIAIRAEQRLCIVHYRRKAICRGSFVPAS